MWLLSLEPEPQARAGASFCCSCFPASPRLHSRMHLLSKDPCPSLGWPCFPCDPCKHLAASLAPDRSVACTRRHAGNAGSKPLGGCPVCASLRAAERPGHWGTSHGPSGMRQGLGRGRRGRAACWDGLQLCFGLCHSIASCSASPCVCPCL